MNIKNLSSPSVLKGLLASVCFSALALNTHAQDSEQNSSRVNPDIQDNLVDDNDVIIVHAYKDERALKDLPVSISVLSSDYLDQRQYQTLEQISAAQPGVDISKNSNSGKVFVRGIGSQGNAGLEQSASTYIDDIYFGRSRSSKAILTDIKQVEILKGPQSIQLGVNSSAGAISVTSLGADVNDQYGYLDAHIGDYGEAGLTLAYNLPLSDRFALRAVASADRSDGFWDFVDPITGEDVSGDTGHDSYVLRLSGLWQASENFDASFKLETQSVDRNNPFAWQPGRCDNLYGLGLSTLEELDAFWAATGSAQASPLSIPTVCSSDFADSTFNDTSPASPFNASFFDADNFQLKLDWGLGNIKLSSITGAYDTEFNFEGNDLSHGAPFERYLWVRDDNQQISQEFRLSSNSDQPLQWLVGAYYHSSDISYETGDVDLRNSRNPQFIHTEADQSEDLYSLFASADWAFLDDWNLGLGLRWTRVEKTFGGIDERVTNNSVGSDQVDAFNAVLSNDVLANPASYTQFTTDVRNQIADENLSFSDLLPSLSLAYDLNETSRIYYRWESGYKAGGFNFRLNGLDDTTLTFDEETVQAHEIGFKSEWPEYGLWLNAAVFTSNYRDLQQNSNRGDDGVISAAVIRNAARASSDGVELDLSWGPIDALRLDASVTVLDAKFDDYQGADCTRFQSFISNTDVAADFGAARNGNRCSQDLSGGRLTHAPEFTSRSAATWQSDFSDDFNFETTFEWIYSDGFFTSPHADPLRRQASFSKFNARFGLTPISGIWSLDLIGTNLTNKLTARQLGQDEDAAVSGLLDDPRRISLNFRYNF